MIDERNSVAMNKQREWWFETLFSTEPADREAAESGVHAFYEAAELEVPRQIVWLDSPAEACYARGSFPIIEKRHNLSPVLSGPA